MAKKIVLGLAVVGGGLYWYDQNVEPIFSKTKDGRPVAIENLKPSEDVRKEYKQLEKDTKDFGHQLKRTAKESAEDLRQKADSTVSSIKDSEMYNKWSQKLDDYQKDVRTSAEPIDQKPFPNRVAAKYIQFVNGLGQTEDEKLNELASSTSARQQQIKKDLDASSQSWSSWWSGKKSEAQSEKDRLAAKAQSEKNSWVSWGEKKADDAEARVKQEKKSWFSWGNKKADEAQKTAQDAKSDLEHEKNKWISWGSSKAEDAKQAAKDTKGDLEHEKNKWVSWGSSKADEAQKAAKDAQGDLEHEKNKWVNWGSAKADEAQKSANAASKDLSNAYEDSKQALSENFEAGKKRAIEEYNNAKANLDSLTQQAQGKANEVIGETEKAHLRKARDDLSSAFNNLKKFGSDLVDK